MAGWRAVSGQWARLGAEIRAKRGNTRQELPGARHFLPPPGAICRAGRVVKRRYRSKNSGLKIGTPPIPWRGPCCEGSEQNAPDG